MAIWHILWPFGIFFVIWYIFCHLVYFMAIWYIFPVLECCAKKKLATLPCDAETPVSDAGVN
jgi:hypothetical protein